MKTERSTERLVFFSDAVVAIALTVLILPLTELVPELEKEHGHSIDVIAENQWQIYSFLLSFFVIGRQWLSHHRLFAQVRAHNPVLLWLNLGWLLAIVVLPFPTEMVGAFGTDEFTVLFYIGATLASSAFLSAILLLVRSNPELAKEPGGISDAWRLDAVGSTIALAAAFLLALLVPAVNYFALLLLVIPPQIARIRYGRRAG